MEEQQRLAIKIHRSFYSFERGQMFDWCERDKRK